MELVISRILKFLNGCLEDDAMYRVAKYIVRYYREICSNEHSIIDVNETFTTEELNRFVHMLHYESIEDFTYKLKADNQYRLEMIHQRLRNMDMKSLYGFLDEQQEDVYPLIFDELYEQLDKAKRIIIIGGPFSCHLSMDFQADMITLGKEVMVYHRFDTSITFTEDDMVIFMTATGRTLEHYIDAIVPKSIERAHTVLITQNIKYKHNNLNIDHVIHAKGKFDGLRFNYQMMIVLDLLRIGYYQKYYARGR